ncbi:hypothetical protein J6590_082028 [Homalodisca vitripennis]|nr:hypothetical protein J6590_082028 [Homalodisca vitripennis]
MLQIGKQVLYRRHDLSDASKAFAAKPAPVSKDSPETSSAFEDALVKTFYLREIKTSVPPAFQLLPYEESSPLQEGNGRGSSTT